MLSGMLTFQQYVCDRSDAIKNLVCLLGIVIVVFVLWDGFETIVFPRYVTRKFRLTRMFYHYTWLFWSKAARILARKSKVETMLSFYGPLSLLLLLVVWASGLIVGFGLIHWAIGSATGHADHLSNFIDNLYLSGSSFFTLGLGDVLPGTSIARLLTVVESGLGFGFLALVIGYIPALNQSFSRREMRISMLDSRAGSPPTTGQILLRYCAGNRSEELRQLLVEWETWAAELLESHLSYPSLAYFRSQHDNQSWLSTITAILDVSTLLAAYTAGPCSHQARLTFAMARHAVVDLSIIFNTPPREPRSNRLSPDDLQFMKKSLAKSGFAVTEDNEAHDAFAEWRRMYEPYLYALGHFHCMEVPPWVIKMPLVDNWKTSAWKNVETRDAKERHHF